MATGKGFWSYVHADDDTEGGRISRLAQDVVNHYQMITTETIELFLDRDKLEWGDEWKSKIDSALTEVAFFIPVVTPRYFQSHECRREFSFFARKVAQLGIKELVMPIRYLDFPTLHEDPCEDDLIVLSRSFQWAEWDDLRFSSTDSPEYRRGVSKLAQRLADASAHVEAITITDPTVELIDEDDDDAPGYLDKLAKTEETMPEWTGTMELIAADITNIGEIMGNATAEIERSTEQGKGFAARVAITHRVADNLENPVNNIQELANQFSAQLHNVDLGVRTVIERAPEEIRTNPESAHQILEFFDSLRELISSAEDGLGAAEELVQLLEPIEQGSRKLRPVVRTLRKALLVMLDGRDITRNWANEMDQLVLPSNEEPDSPQAKSIDSF